MKEATFPANCSSPADDASKSDLPLSLWFAAPLILSYVGGLLTAACLWWACRCCCSSRNARSRRTSLNGEGGLWRNLENAWPEDTPPVCEALPDSNTFNAPLTEGVSSEPLRPPPRPPQPPPPPPPPPPMRSGAPRDLGESRAQTGLAASSSAQSSSSSASSTIASRTSSPTTTDFFSELTAGTFTTDSISDDPYQTDGTDQIFTSRNRLETSAETIARGRPAHRMQAFRAATAAAAAAPAPAAAPPAAEGETSRLRTRERQRRREQIFEIRRKREAD